MLTPEQEWKAYVRREGFICGDMAGAKRAFLDALKLARGDPYAADIAVLDKMDGELEFLWSDPYTARCLEEQGVGNARKLELLNAFKRQCQARAETHATYQLARQHFLFWVEKVKNVDFNGNSQPKQQYQSPKDWQGDILSRIGRLAGG
jgi:hypothetical protein